MPDAFFSKPRPFSKRKREGEGEGSQRSGKPSSRNQTSSRGARGGSSSRGRGRGHGRRDGGNDRNDNKGKRRQEDEDEELDLPDDGAFDSDDQGSQQDGAAAEESSEEEDELETPAQKRLRLSQMYLQSLEKDKEGKFRPRYILLNIEADHDDVYRRGWLRCSGSRQGYHRRTITAGCCEFSLFVFPRSLRSTQSDLFHALRSSNIPANCTSMSVPQ